MDTKRQQASNDPEPTTNPASGAVDEVPALESNLACEGGDAPGAVAEAPVTQREPAAEPAAAPVPAPARKPRGFAAMDRALVREMARRGARASQAKGTAHRFTSDEARAAGRKGGSAPHRVRGRGKSERPGA